MKKQNGQIVLMTLLILTVAVTLVLAFIGRTTTNTAITSQLEDSARAFNAAEAGVESALKSGANSTATLTGGEKFDVKVTAIGGATGVYEFPKKTTTDSTETLWLVGHNGDGSINESSRYTGNTMTLCWSQETVMPALSLSVLYKRSGVYYVARAAYDADPTRRALNSFFAPTSSGTGCGKPNMNVHDIDFSLDFNISIATDTVVMLRMRPVYGPASILVDPLTNTLPLQAKRIESTGSVTAGSTRKIVVYQLYKTPPSLFDAVLYSQSPLSH